MNEKIKQLLQHPATLPTATAVAGFAAGALVGFWRTKSQYDHIEEQLEETRSTQFKLDLTDAAVEAEVNRRVKEEISKMPELLGYSQSEDNDSLEALRDDHPRGRVITSAKLHSVGIHPSGSTMPGTSIVDYTKVGEDQNPEVSGTVTPIRREGVTVNVFDNGAGDEWDYKTEIENRDKTRPYVIHVDEYVSDEMGWDSQSTLTWYEKDQILCDTHDKPIYNHSDVVGDLRFGHGSNDPNVVYIRNEHLKAEFEVLRDEGSYEEIVLGEQMERRAQIDELKHSATPRFRPE